MVLKVALLACVFVVANCALADVAPLPAYCENSTYTKDLWETYVCETTRTKVQPECTPKRLWAGTGPSDTTAKGLVVLFHGYTACSDAYKVYANHFQKAGYHVLNLLNVGHGRSYGDCSGSAQCVNNDPVELLPTNRSEYLSYVDQVNAIVTEHVDTKITKGATFETIVVGHSLGGGLATIAAIHGNSGDKKTYDKLLMLSPFLGVTVPDVDKSVTDCSSNRDKCISHIAESVVNSLFAKLSTVSSGKASFVAIVKKQLNDTVPADTADVYNTANSMLRFVLVQAVENPQILPSPIRDQLAAGIGWGQKCETDRTSNLTKRAGICNFQIRNLLAVHSQGQYALSKADTLKHSIRTQFIGVERDGNNRNSLAWQVMQAFDRSSSRITTGSAGSFSTGCIFRAVPGCNITEKVNICGVPHAFVASGDVLGVPPYSMYWEDTVLKEITSFFDKGTEAGSGSFGDAINRDICQRQSLMSPPVELIATPVRVIRITLKETKANLVKQVRDKIVKQIATATGLPEWLVPMIRLPFSPSGARSVSEITVTMPTNASFAKLPETLGGIEVVSISDPLAAVAAAPTSTDASASGAAKLATSFALMSVLHTLFFFCLR